MTTSKKATSSKTTTKVVKLSAKANGKSSGNGDRATIAELLKKLEVATLRSDKQQIRRQLRALGHRGGLNCKPGAGSKAK